MAVGLERIVCGHLGRHGDDWRRETCYILVGATLCGNKPEVQVVGEKTVYTRYSSTSEEVRVTLITKREAPAVSRDQKLGTYSVYVLLT